MKKKIKIELAPIIMKKDDEKISEQREEVVVWCIWRLDDIQHKKGELENKLRLFFLGFSSGGGTSRTRIVHTCGTTDRTLIW